MRGYRNKDSADAGLLLRAGLGAARLFCVLLCLPCFSVASLALAARRAAMTRGRGTCAVVRLAAAAFASLPAAAWPHAFGERYDLPAPLNYFVAGATVTVALSFVVAVLIARGVSRTFRAKGLVIALGPLLLPLRLVCRTVSVVLFALVVVAGLYGTRNPEMNVAPTLVWIIGWVGLSLVVACIGNLWPALDPWRTLFDMMDALARRSGAASGIALGLTYPRALGAWPAVILLLAFTWLEVVNLQAAVPLRIAQMLLAWSALTLTGMVCFGRETWQRNGDVFAIYFATLGRFAPLAAGPDRRSIVLRPYGRALIATDAGSIAMVAFVVAMLSTVLFDGMLGGQVWWFTQYAFNRWLPSLADDKGYLLGTIGLIAVWLFFFAVYLLTCLVTARLVRNHSIHAIACLFALTLVPIAVAYQIAHNLSNLLVQGQLVVALLSDPLGRGWDLFGTAQFYPTIGIVDARTTWYVAISAIVAGHVISIWLAHRVALREFGDSHKAVIASIPLTVLMVIYTAISLSVIAEPLVRFRTPDAPSALNGK